MSAGWTPLALARDIPPGAAAGAVLDGAEIVLWRDATGAIHAWEDRCPHRGMKLSFGFVKGDRLACLYHGWEYDGGGRCRHIPAHPELDVPASIRTNAHAAAEALGLVFVHVAAGPDLPPPPTDPGDPVTPLRSLFLDADAEEVAAALARGLPGLGPARVSGGGVLRSVEQGGHRLHAGLHRIGPARAALHLTVAGAAGGAALDRIARAAEAFRRAVEGGAAAA